MIYHSAKDYFSIDGKTIDKSHKDFMPLVCGYVIEEVSKGKSLVEIVPLESEAFPLLSDILSEIDSSELLSEKYAKAERVRLTITREKLLKYADLYKNNPSTDNRDVFTALEKTYTSLKKGQEESGTVILKFNQILPDSFWDEREVVTPENPREGETK